jgi:mono/diheme cytochrome c family protein
MTPSPRFVMLAPVVAAAALAVGGCGEEGIHNVSAANRSGAAIFSAHCGACHTLDPAGTQGSATNVRTREYKDGPNFNQRKEQVADVLYAIRNGGFSSGPMPQDIVTGPDAEKVAKFVAAYSGKQAGQATGASSGGTGQGGPTQPTGGG